VGPVGEVALGSGDQFAFVENSKSNAMVPNCKNPLVFENAEGRKGDPR
jgi:hypothetical protein